MFLLEESFQVGHVFAEAVALLGHAVAKGRELCLLGGNGVCHFLQLDLCVLVRCCSIVEPLLKANVVVLQFSDAGLEPLNAAVVMGWLTVVHVDVLVAVPADAFELFANGGLKISAESLFYLLDLVCGRERR